MMRIITGKAKGIKLKTLEGDHTRPTAERVKEAIFSVLQFDIEGRNVLDLFSGSGQLALEALSRGAAQAVMLDNSPEAIKTIKANAQNTKLNDQCRIYNINALDFIKRNSDIKFDIIFLDPPYNSNYYDSVLEELSRSSMLKPTTVIVCESDREVTTTKITEKYNVTKEARYGRIMVTFLSPIVAE